VAACGEGGGVPPQHEGPPRHHRPARRDPARPAAGGGRVAEERDGVGARPGRRKPQRRAPGRHRPRPAPRVGPVRVAGEVVLRPGSGPGPAGSGPGRGRARGRARAGAWVRTNGRLQPSAGVEPKRAGRPPGGLSESPVRVEPKRAGRPPGGRGRLSESNRSGRAARGRAISARDRGPRRQSRAGWRGGPAATVRVPGPR
jgi:hypothetical protein